MEPPGPGSTIGERLSWTRQEWLRKGVRELARDLQSGYGMETLTHVSVGRYESGERVPDANYLEAILRRARVNPRWLLLGEETPHPIASDMLARQAIAAIRLILDRLDETTSLSVEQIAEAVQGETAVEISEGANQAEEGAEGSQLSGDDSSENGIGRRDLLPG
jgi:transcriptional regulator with XRE-family HTH domain